jgi:ABC-type multidrug transport system ATPase subunit
LRASKWAEFRDALRKTPWRAPAVLIPAVPPPLEVQRLHISIRNVSKIYPMFQKRNLLHFLPSRIHRYGCRPLVGKKALDHVDLEIGPGMFGLLGPNGAGKTTLMQILTGLIPPTFGEAEVAGHDLGRHRWAIRSLVSYLPQNFGVYGALTLAQYLEFFAPFYGLNDRADRKRKIDEAIDMAGLVGATGKPMRSFSGGMRQRAGIAQLLLHPSPVLIVDEPTAGLDPVERVRFRLLLSQLAQTRIVILSTHIVDDITSSCRAVAVLNHGRVIYHGDLEKILAAAQGLIWDVTVAGSASGAVAARSVLYKKHVGDGVLYHYVSDSPIPGSVPVAPSFEDAYVALLFRHDTTASRNGPNGTIPKSTTAPGFAAPGTPEFAG